MFNVHLLVWKGKMFVAKTGNIIWNVNDGLVQ